MKGLVILIGSVARQDYFERSDIDICRINSDVIINRELNWPKGPINYIDYDFETFEHLNKLGSLFIYHILEEGVLLQGNLDYWESLKSSFSFKGNKFKEEINSTIELNTVLKDIEMFGNHYLTLFSNLFTNVKNFSIFHLAGNGIYLFNKEQAIKKVFGDYHYDLLIDSYNFFERGITNEKWNYSCKETAINVTNYYLSKMEALTIC